MLATARKHRDQQQRLTALAVRQARRTSNARQALQTVAAYQVASASLAVEYAEVELAEQGLAASGATLQAGAFVVNPGSVDILDDAETALKFDMIVAGLVADAGRSAAGAFTSSRATEYGHVRHLVTPSCSRCAVLAGRFYRWSTGFQRHPNCDCIMVPSSANASDDLVSDPMEAFKNGQISDLSKSEADAIRDGADISQVVNVRRGMTEVNFMGRRLSASTEGTTVRGQAWRGRTGRNMPARLTPESIYRVADDRADALRMLKLHGYIT